MNAMARPKLLEWRPLHKNTLRAFAKVQFCSGLIVSEIAVHVAGSRISASPQSRPWVKGNAVVIDEATGKLKWQPVLDFANHGVRSSWSRQVLAALCEAQPEAVSDGESGT